MKSIRYYSHILLATIILMTCSALMAQDEESEKMAEKPKKSSPQMDLSKTSMDELRSLLAEAVSKEDYEKASDIRDEINRRSR